MFKWWMVLNRKRMEQQGDDGGVSDVAGVEDDGDVDFLDEMFSTPEDESEEVVEETPESDEPEEEPEEETPEEVPEEIPEVKPEVTEEGEPDHQEPPTVETPEEFAARKQQYLEDLEKEFALSEEDDRLMMENPNAVIPKLLVKAYDRITSDVMRAVGQQFQQVPQMVQRYNEVRQEQESLDNKFLEVNPALKEVPKEEMAVLIQNMAPLIGSQMPNATVEEKMQALGRAIASFKGINDSPAPMQKPKRENVTPHKPSAPARSGVVPEGEPQLSEQDAFLRELISDD